MRNVEVLTTHALAGSIGRVLQRIGPYQWRRIGSCYVVGTDQVMTCDHVVRDGPVRPDQPPPPLLACEELRVEFVIDGVPNRLRVTELDNDPFLDACILTIAASLPPDRSLPLTSVDAAARSKSVCYGFPTVIADLGVCLAVPGIVLEGRWSFESMPPALLLQSSIDRHDDPHGLSGSPVIVDGFVVGHVRSCHAADHPHVSFSQYRLLHASPMSDVLRRFGAKLKAPRLGGTALQTKEQRPEDLFAHFQRIATPDDATAAWIAEELIWHGTLEWRLKALDILVGRNSVRCRQLLGLTYHKIGGIDNLRRAVAVLELLVESQRDGETLGILAGVLKSLFRELSREGASRSAEGDAAIRRSSMLYREGLDSFPDNHYLAINAMTTARLSIAVGNGDPDITPATFAALTRRAIDRVAESMRDHWWHASLAEYHFLLGDTEGARRSYLAAQQASSCRRGHVRTMRQQVQLVLRTDRKDPHRHDDWFALRSAPFTSADVVPGQRLVLGLEKVVDDLRIDHVWCSMGLAVLPMLKTVLERGGTAHIAWPADETFGDQPSEAKGATWREWFKKLPEVQIDDLAAGSSARDHILNLAWQRTHEKTAVVVWDGVDQSPRSPASFVRSWEGRGGVVVVVHPTTGRIVTRGEAAAD